MLGTQESLNLSSWGLPDYILQKYSEKGIKCMFPWQVECLTSGDVLNGGNLVYSAPTSAGKTLVAEILTLQTVLEKKKKVIIILPFVSVVREKMLYFQELLSGSGIRVEGFMGSYSPPGGFRAVHIAICTIEKANSLINRLLEERSFENIGCVVVDELHLLGDPHRGYLLELLLTKIKYISQKGMTDSIQIIGMSATLPNLNLLALWLDATLYKTDFRPIPLHEYIKVNRKLFKSPECNLSQEIIPSFTINKDPGDVIYLCIDTILKGYSALVFCPTKNWCETLAQQISAEIKKIGTSQNQTGLLLREQLDSKKISDVLEQLKKSPAGLEQSLGRSVSFGVGFHHAGLTMDERDIIEGAFRKNIIRIIIATSTLSSGVNLPARRVIIRSPLFNGRSMDILTYKQMIGRAGRMGKDTQGESYLICTEEDKFTGLQLASADLPPVESCLGQGDLSSSLKRAILEVIASGIVKTKNEIETYTNCSLLAQSVGFERIEDVVSSCLDNLQQLGFLVTHNNEDISPSSLAEACFSASIPPDQGLVLTGELGKARKCFVLETDLHALYQVIPLSICDYWDIDWGRAFSIWESLSDEIKKVGYLIGVEERFIIKAMRSSINIKDNAKKISLFKRFYTALALQDLVNEVSLRDVADKYGCNKGMLQSLQQSASTFAGMVTSFCRKLSWGALEVVVAELGRRIQFGVQRDLLDLMRIDCMTSVLARGLFNSGITTLPELASSSLQSVQTAIRKAIPFSSDVNVHEEKKDICLPGRPGLSDIETADIFIHEARTFLLREMGVKTAEWSAPSTSIYDYTTFDGGRSRHSERSDSKIKNRSIQETSQNKKLDFSNMSPVAQILENVVPETQEISYKNLPNSQFNTLDDTIDMNKSHILFGTPDNEKRDSTKIKSSTPINTPDIDIRDMTKIKSSTPINTPDIDKRDMSKIKSSTPINILDIDINRKKWSIGSNHSGSDLFAESYDIEKIVRQNIEEIDPNLGGDSIIELSILADEIISSNRKRKISESESFEYKKPRLVNESNNFSDFFKDNINIDSKLENILDLGQNVQKTCFLNTILADAFEETFDKVENVKAAELIIETEKSPSKCSISSPIPDKTSFVIENTPVLNRTPKKWKRNNSSKSNSSKSPSKYSSVGVSIIKSSKSPNKTESKGPNIDAIFQSIKSDINSTDVELCPNEKLLEEFIHKFINIKEAAFYIKTSAKIEKRIGVNFLKQENPELIHGSSSIINIQIFFNNKNYIFDLRKSGCPCIKVLKNILGMKDKSLITYNIKEDLKLLYKCTRILVRGEIKDVGVADWLIHPNDNIRPINQMMQEYLSTSEQESTPGNKSTSPIRIIMSLWNSIKKKLFENDLLNFFNDIEVPLLQCILHMELTGLKFDRNKSTLLWEKVDSTMKSLEDRVYSLAGHRFSITSRKDLNLMKNLLKITPENEPNSEFMKTIHNWRKLSSLKSRNLSQLLTCLEQDQRCRGISSGFTSTGRIVMHDPNLQHVPRDFIIDQELFSPRSSFIPHKGNIFLSADYSQLELRILAHFSQDKVLLSLINSEHDVFVSIAANWNNINHSQVTDEIRQQTKQIIYGIIYGMGDKTLGDHLGISPSDAGMMAAKFRRKYPGVQLFLKKCIDDCSKNGFILTITGRKRLLPGINSSNRSEKNQAERQAVNSTIQGSAADIAKRAMVKIDKRLNEALPSRNNTFDGPSSHLVLHLHDEFLYEVSHENLVLVKQIVKYEMENSTNLSVKLPVVIKIGSSWGSLKKI